MKKSFSLLVILLMASLVLFANGTKEDKKNAAEKTLTVYAYDAFCSDWGPGPSVIPAFEEATGIKVDLVSAGSGIEMINKIKAEGDRCRADVVVGITDDSAYLAIDLLQPYSSADTQDIFPELIFDQSGRLIPFDYGNFAFVYDTEASITPPKSLQELTKSEYKGKVILIDPRTSSVGMGLLLWTYNEMGDACFDWWKAMKDNALTIASGWSSAYGLFTEGEAPIVLSYTTSPVYHVENDNTTRYQTLIFENGHETIIEAMGILKNAKNVESAKTFIDYMLTVPQVEIARMNSMYPVNRNTVLPASFEYAPKPAKLYKSGQVGKEKTDELLSKWKEVMVK